MENPQIPKDVVDKFDELTLSVISSGWKHYSAEAILNRIRWHMHVEVRNRDFKLNNNWKPFLARSFMSKYPQHKGFFWTRTSKYDVPDPLAAETELNPEGYGAYMQDGISR